MEERQHAEGRKLPELASAASQPSDVATALPTTLPGLRPERRGLAEAIGNRKPNVTGIGHATAVYP
jgi:hypothetical protein